VVEGGPFLEGEEGVGEGGRRKRRIGSLPA